VRTYSRGMEQRAAIARLLLHGPELLLLDEPYTGLDPEARELLDGVIRDATERGGGVVLITHHLDEAARVGSRLSILWEGRLVVPPPDAVAIGTGSDALAAAATFYEGLFRAHARSRGIQGPPGPLHEAQHRRGT
jgi:ABC-type multidrug transport system ATPase subunit